MTYERTSELLNKVIDNMIELEGLRPRPVIESLLSLGFTADELIELKFSAEDVHDLAAKCQSPGLERVLGDARERSAIEDFCGARKDRDIEKEYWA